MFPGALSSPNDFFCVPSNGILELTSCQVSTVGHVFSR